MARLAQASSLNFTGLVSFVCPPLFAIPSSTVLTVFWPSLLSLFSPVETCPACLPTPATPPLRQSLTLFAPHQAHIPPYISSARRSSFTSPTDDPALPSPRRVGRVGFSPDTADVSAQQSPRLPSRVPQYGLGITFYKSDGDAPPPPPHFCSSPPGCLLHTARWNDDSLKVACISVS